MGRMEKRAETVIASARMKGGICDWANQNLAGSITRRPDEFQFSGLRGLYSSSFFRFALYTSRLKRMLNSYRAIMGMATII